ncbi:response regulator transcription factor [Actinocorallia longicatena]|uniref:Response regulator transcription factor n=1 Tax=Actinocorallia longicatena TaxID=111803 RepID=A0ABP6QGB1_9ACTN
MSVRIVVIDGNTLSRHGLAQVVTEQKDLVIAATAVDAAGGRTQIGMLRPEVAVVAQQLPDTDGLTLTAELRQLYPDLGVVVLGTGSSDSPLFRAMEAGASAYVAKSAAVPEFLSAIRHAAVAPQSFTAAELAAALRRRRTEAVLLTPREQETLRLLQEGLPIAAIARAMNLSHNTTKTYTARLYDKLGAGNRTQALMKALRLGLISHEPPERLHAS